MNIQTLDQNLANYLDLLLYFGKQLLPFWCPVDQCVHPINVNQGFEDMVFFKKYHLFYQEKRMSKVN